MRLAWIAVTLALMATGYAVLRSVDIDVFVALVAAAAILLVGRLSGLSWFELGLARSTWLRGLAWAAGTFVVVIAAYVVLLVTPLNVLLEDNRYDDGWAQAWVTALVLVPLGTVLWEEIAFRGVLWAQLRHYWSTATATIVSSVIFGIWHAIPALRFADSNQAAGAVVTDTGTATIGTVVITVIATGLAGLLLCELRRRSDSLLAPIGLHWAVNGVGVLAVALASSA